MNSAEKQTVLHCLKSMIDEAVCEECPLYGMTGTDHCEKDCVRLAINALEQEPCTDAISREAALKCFTLNNTKADAWNNIKALPPVASKLIECGDCVSRQAVLLHTRTERGNGHEQPFDYVEADVIRQLPPVKPAEKVGQWIDAEVLDKIRTEILAMMPPLGNWMYDEGHIEEQTACEVIADVVQIIDKYKASPTGAERSE